jgi:hypothetical protein
VLHSSPVSAGFLHTFVPATGLPACQLLKITVLAMVVFAMRCDASNVTLRYAASRVLARQAANLSPSFRSKGPTIAEVGVALTPAFGTACDRRFKSIQLISAAARPPIHSNYLSRNARAIHVCHALAQAAPTHDVRAEGDRQITDNNRTMLRGELHANNGDTCSASAGQQWPSMCPSICPTITCSYQLPNCQNVLRHSRNHRQPPSPQWKSAPLGKLKVTARPGNTIVRSSLELPSTSHRKLHKLSTPTKHTCYCPLAAACMHSLTHFHLPAQFCPMC